MTCVVRHESLHALAEYVACNIPELDGQICVGQADPGHRQTFPSLAIDPVRWAYFPDQAAEVSSPAFDRVIHNVGRHESVVQLRIGAATVGERRELEQRVLDLFLSTPLHPGVVLVTVRRCEAVGPFVASFTLDEDEWQDEMVFDGKAYSVVTATAIVPALATRLDAFPMNELEIGLSQSLESESIDADFPADAEVVAVEEDGTVSVPEEN